MEKDKNTKSYSVFEKGGEGTMKKMVKKAILFVTSFTLLVACSNNGTDIKSVAPVLNNGGEPNQPSSEIMPLQSSDIPSAPSSNIEQPSSDIVPSTSINNQSSEVSERDHHISEDFNFDEYYCESDDSYIRLYENGYLQYDGNDYYFINRYSSTDSVIIVNYNYLSKENGVSTYKKDFIYFELLNNTLTINQAISVFNGDFSLKNKSFSLKRRFINESASYYYTKSIAQNLLITLGLKTTLTSQENILADLELLAYSNNVDYFYHSDFSDSADINFSFDVNSINISQIVSVFMAKQTNSIITSLNYCFDDNTLTRSVNISSVGLANQDLYTNYQVSDAIEGSSAPYILDDGQDYLCFKTKDEAINYSNHLKQINEKRYKKIIAYLDNLNDADFLNNDLYFSNIVTAENSAVNFSVKNVYLKNNELFVVLDKNSINEFGSDVLSYFTFPFFISENIIIDSITTIY